MALAALCTALPALARAADEPEPYNRWYVVEVSGHRAGWKNSTMTVDGDRITTQTKMRITLKRSRGQAGLGIDSTFVETKDGKPISMTYVQQFGSMPLTQQYTFEPDHIDVVTTQGDTSSKSRQPLPDGVWLTPHAAEQYVSQRLEAGAEKITIRSIDPTNGVNPVVATHEIVGHTQVEALGKTVPAIKWVTSMDTYPGIKSTEYVDQFGTSIRSDIDIGVMKMTVLLADKDLAQADIDPPELLVSTLVKPDRPIDGARGLRRAVYTLSTTDGAKMPTPPQTGAQRCEPLGDGKVRVTVDLDNVPAAPDEDVKNQAYTSASAMADSSDPQVRELTAQAIKDAGDDPAARAEAMRNFVHNYISSKSLDVGFATASEVTRTRAGDCSEHAVLLVAMLRADGIPARAASGLIYAGHFAGRKSIFGYHMWAQALLTVGGKPRWVNLDAVLGPEHRADATHILLDVSDLSDSSMGNTMVRLAPLLGRLKIDVDQVAGKPAP